MHRGLRITLNFSGRTLVAALCGDLGIAPRLALADDANGSKAAPAVGDNSSPQYSTDAFRAPGSWRLVRNPSEAAALHTADFERSDPRWAALMLRCGREGVEAVVVVVEPFPPHARPQITLRAPGQKSQFIGTIISTGAGIRLATSLVTGPWRTPPDLEIKLTAGAAAIDGVVALSGLPKALHSFKADCIQK
jgi:hypothetical protein